MIAVDERRQASTNGCAWLGSCLTRPNTPIDRWRQEGIAQARVGQNGARSPIARRRLCPIPPPPSRRRTLTEQAAWPTRPGFGAPPLAVSKRLDTCRHVRTYSAVARGGFPRGRGVCSSAAAPKSMFIPEIRPSQRTPAYRCTRGVSDGWPPPSRAQGPDLLR